MPAGKGYLMITTRIEKLEGGSRIILPKAVLDAVDISCSDIVEITAENNAIIIRKQDPINNHKSLKQRLETFYGKDIETILAEAGNNPFTFGEWNTGESVGNEVF